MFKLVADENFTTDTTIHGEDTKEQGEASRWDREKVIKKLRVSPCYLRESPCNKGVFLSNKKAHVEQTPGLLARPFPILNLPTQLFR